MPAKTWVVTYYISQEIEAPSGDVAHARAETIEAKLMEALTSIREKWNIGDPESEYELEEQESEMPELTPPQEESNKAILFMAFFTQDYKEGEKTWFLMHCDLCRGTKKGFATKQEAQQFGEEHSYAVHGKPS